MIKKIKNNLFFKDNNNNLGAIRLTCGILGSLIVSYLAIILVGKHLEYTIFENIVMTMIILPLFWSAFAMWIVLSETKFNSILKTIISFMVLYILVYMV